MLVSRLQNGLPPLPSPLPILLFSILALSACSQPVDGIAIYNQIESELDSDETDWDKVNQLKNQLKNGFKESSEFTAEILYIEAAQLFEMQRYAPAMQRLSEAIKTDPDNKELRENCMILGGEIALIMENTPAALRTFEEVAQAYPQNVHSRRRLAEMYYDLGVLQRTMQLCGEISLLAPDDPQPERMMGMLSKDFARNKAAIEHYREALRRDPDFEDAEDVRVELATVHVTMRQHPQALQVLQQLKNPRTADALSIAAQCHLALGDIQAAANSCDQALKDSPRHEKTLETRGIIHMESGESSDARKFFEKTIAVNPANDQALFKLAAVCQQMRDAENAEKYQNEYERIKELKLQYIELSVATAQRQGGKEQLLKLAELAQQLHMPAAARDWIKAASVLQVNQVQAPENEPPSE